MGITYKAYVGPVIVCKKKITVHDKHSGCVKEGCPQHHVQARGKVKFCPECGTQIGLFTTPREVSAVEVWELFDGKEPFTKAFADYPPKALKDFDILLPNYRRDYDPDEDDQTRRQFFVYVDDGTTCQNMTDIKQGDELHWLMTTYKTEIEKLKEAYGNENVQFRWGFLTWGS